MIPHDRCSHLKLERVDLFRVLCHLFALELGLLDFLATV